MIHILREILSCYYNNEQFEIYELFISGFFHLLFLDCNLPQVPKTVDSKATGKRKQLYQNCLITHLFKENECGKQGNSFSLRWKLIFKKLIISDK
jgi:hypothetical protein